VTLSEEFLVMLCFQPLYSLLCVLSVELDFYTV